MVCHGAHRGAGHHPGWCVLYGLLWIGFTALFFRVAYHWFPGVRELVDNLMWAANLTVGNDFGDHSLNTALRESKTLETVTVETGPNPTATILWMHGLGADGHDFEPLVPELLAPGTPALRFVFPHAPVRPVTINNGYEMRAWYDIFGIDRRAAEDQRHPGIGRCVSALIREQNARGIASERIVLAGFSQGGAIALHRASVPEKSPA